MNNFSIQNLTLMMMLIVLVNTLREPSPEEKLKEIGKDAKNLSKDIKNNIWVEIMPRVAQICVPNFFCFAEKILKRAPNVTNKRQSQDLQKLTNHLHVYNNMTNASCRNFTTNNHQELAAFLKEIQTCVDHKIHHPPTE